MSDTSLRNGLALPLSSDTWNALYTSFHTNFETIDAAIAKCNFSGGAVDPDADNDETQGYSMGSKWYTTEGIWLCKDALEGAAVWVQIYPFQGISDHGALAGLTDDDHTIYMLASGTRALSSALILAQIASPAAPAAGYTKLYTKTDGKLYIRPAGGSESEVGSGNGDVFGPSTHAASLVPVWNTTPDSKTLLAGYALGTAANNIVQLNGDAKLPAVDGSLLTNLPIPDIDTGTIWADIPATPTRVSDTQFTMPDNTGSGNIAEKVPKGTVIKWEKNGGGFQMAIVSSSVYAADVVTVDILGNTLATGFTSMKMCVLPAIEEVFIVPGNMPGNTATTDIARSFMPQEARYYLAAQVNMKTAPTTTNGVWDINYDLPADDPDGGAVTMFSSSKPTATAGSKFGTIVGSSMVSGTSLASVPINSIITLDYDSGHATTPGADAYIHLWSVPVSWRYRT